MKMLNEQQVADLMSVLQEKFETLKPVMQKYQNFLLEFKKIEDKLSDYYHQNGQITKRIDDIINAIETTKEEIETVIEQGDDKKLSLLMKKQKANNDLLKKCHDDRDDLIAKFLETEQHLTETRASMSEFINAEYVPAAKPFLRFDLQQEFLMDMSFSIMKRCSELKIFELKIK